MLNRHRRNLKSQKPGPTFPPIELVVGNRKLAPMHYQLRQGLTVSSDKSRQMLKALQQQRHYSDKQRAHAASHTSVSFFYRDTTGFTAACAAHIFFTGISIVIAGALVLASVVSTTLFNSDRPIQILHELSPWYDPYLHGQSHVRDEVRSIVENISIGLGMIIGFVVGSAIFACGLLPWLGHRLPRIFSKYWNNKKLAATKRNLMALTASSNSDSPEEVETKAKNLAIQPISSCPLRDAMTERPELQTAFSNGMTLGS